MNCAKRFVHRIPLKCSYRGNEELKQLVAGLSLQVHRLKKTSIPMHQGAGGISG